MNKFLLIFVITLAYVYADSESSESEEDKSGLEAFFDKLNATIYSDIIQLTERVEKQCPDIEDRFNSTLEEIGQCFEGIEDSDATLCTLLRENLVKCSQPITKVIEGCLPEQSRKIPTLGVKIIKAVIDQACNSTVEQILELFNPCVAEKNFASFPACVKVQNVLVEHKDKVPSTASVCSTLPLLQSCAKSHREASCPNPITRNAVIKFYEAINSATSEECQGTNEI